MATDDRISEDVSTPVALCTDHVENGVRMDRAGSLVTTVDAVLEKARGDAESSPSMEGGLTAAGMAKNRDPIAPVSNGAHKSRNLHLDVKDSRRRTLTSINPTALETLMTLVQEIQSSGATDPEIWRDCEVRWLQLFQLVEKQYRDQILSQQEQYQRQVQLIQDEIKALVQLQNLPRSAQNPGSSPTSGAGDSPALPGPLTPHLLTSKSPDSARAGRLRSKAQESREEGITTVSSSGYATLSTWGGEGGGPSSPYGLTPDSELLNPESQQELTNRVSPGAPPANRSPSAAQPKAPSVFTSWAQKRGKPGSRSGRSRRCRAGEEEEEEEEGGSSLSADGDRREEDYRAASLKRSDSLISEASGLTYWRLDEDELYRPLPDSFDSGAYLLLQDLSLNQISQDGPTLPVSLREIYQRKQQEGRAKRDGWDSSFTSNASTPQVLTLDPTLHMKQSDRTSGFTSPSHFSSPSSPHQPPLGRGVSAAPILSPDSVSEGPSVRDLSDPNGSSPGLSPASTPVEEGPNNEGAYQTVLHRFPSPVQSGSNLEKTAASPSSVEDPVIQSLVRQSLKEKHLRHVADLRVYYESEISCLKQQLASRYEDPDGLARSNQDLLERCEHLDRALTEASARIRDLEKEKSHLKSQLADWPERYAAADAAVQALRVRLEDADLGGREKEAALGRLQSRVIELQEALDTASRVSQGQNAEMRKGRDMLQELLAELDSLRKDHERVKDDLVSAENRLFDANSQIAELKRFVSKLESQVKQLEHENLLKTRQMIQARSPGLCQRPDLLLSPSKGRAHLNGDQKQPSPEPDPLAHSGPASDRTAAHISRYYTPSEETPTPVMKVLSRLEESRGSNGFTPHRAVVYCTASISGLGRGRTAAGFVESGGGGPAHPKAQRSLSPEGNRSSLHPPCSRKGTPISTPTKRETLITPLSAEWSPKRCPTENYSTAFGDSPVQRLYRFDGSSDQMDPSSCSLSRSSSLRKRLQFTNEGVEAVHCRPTSGVPGTCNGAEPAEEEQEELAVGLSDSYQAQVQSLADTERLFDDLTQEKQQIEAELSRIPAAGARVTLRTRLDEVALEKRLEKVNHDLGAIRMTLKRFHVLRSSANV
ncbi:hypothetical protein GJAV_G00048180 [Gymnothorax javanicus]|nr:hypothetical protein GJAV_G00048180 [Gymnothorax javanicus]